MKFPHGTTRRRIKNMSEEELKSALYFEMQRSYFFESLSSVHDKEAFAKLANDGEIKAYED